MKKNNGKKGKFGDRPDVDVRPFLKRQFPTEGPSHGITIGKSPKFMWFRVAKVGTRTTLSTLDSLGVTYHLREGFKFSYDADAFKDYFKFAFVRNPWDRIVSCWYNKVKVIRELDFERKKLPKFEDLTGEFEEFVDFLETENLTTCNIHYRLQTRLIPVDNMDFLGRFERFEADLMKILKHLEIPKEDEFESRNVSEDKRPFQEYYTPDLRDRVAELYKADIQAFNYKFDP
ncbi:sulfotransferase family 2 domain-containing protein [Tateyamaria sp.]|uniref:sulfotransferase family 2 domain-containing protein n=1 Tax=Tateyamaria sp. TaxID=1929288 RepID=UPI00329BA1F2